MTATAPTRARLLDAARAVVAGELPCQQRSLIAAALVGGCAEALVGPLARPEADAAETISAIRQFALRAVGA